MLSSQRCPLKSIQVEICSDQPPAGPWPNIWTSSRCYGKSYGYGSKLGAPMDLQRQMQRICKDTFSVAGAVQETCSSEMLGGQGADFLRGVAFWRIRFPVLGIWFCVTGSYDLASLFRGRHNTLDRWSGKIAKRIGARPSALHSTFHFWRKSRRIASFLMLPTLQTEEVSQNCFVSDVVKFKSWGCLAELLRFWCCQVQKLRKACRTASFSSLQIHR